MVNIHHLNFQDTRTPDINLERDGVGIESEVLLGMEAANKKSNRHFKLNLATIVASALIFLMILAWFDFIQTTFYDYIQPMDDIYAINSQTKLYYALLITLIVICLVILIYLHM